MLAGRRVTANRIKDASAIAHGWNSQEWTSVPAKLKATSVIACGADTEVRPNRLVVTLEAGMPIHSVRVA